MDTKGTTEGYGHVKKLVILFLQMAGINKPKTKYLSICSNNLVQIKSQKYFKIDKKKTYRKYLSLSASKGRCSLTMRWSNWCFISGLEALRSTIIKRPAAVYTSG